MRHPLLSSAGLITCLSVIMSAPTAYALRETTMEKEYTFPHTENPLHIETYSTAIYTSGSQSVNTTMGHILADIGSKNSIIDFEVSPAGNTFAIIKKNLKKGDRQAQIYSLSQEKSVLHNFETSKYGMPTSLCFSPDARLIYLATDTGIYIFETRKYKLIGRIDAVGITPDKMAVSPNSYYLALIKDKDIVVYNLENKNIRKRIDAEVKVNDLVFSGNSELMAVLTSDGLLSIYDTRTFDVRTMIDDLGEGIACSFNDNGKYIAIAVNPEEIEVINLMRTSDRKEYRLPQTGMTDLTFLNDAGNNTLLAYSADHSVNARRMHDLEPFYSRLVSESVEGKINDWLKMQPGETMEDYQNRVNESTLASQRRLFEDEISTQLAGDMMAMSEISLGNYDRTNGLLAVEFTNLPAILLPVAETDLASFSSGADLVVEEAQYGLLPDDSFELIYARFLNKNDNKTYIYDNIDRRPMEMMTSDADFVSLDILRQQQMEEIALQEIKTKVMEDAKHNNVISDHTNIAIDSRVQPDYDAEGNRILNYIVRVEYDVEPGFSATEDFGPGKYHVSESGAASSMLKIVKEAFEGDMKQYLKPGKRLKITLSGTADATPILRGISYDGSYGNFEEEPIRVDGVLAPLTVTTKTGITTNPQLALLRAAGVRDFLQKNLQLPEGMNAEYEFIVGVSQDKGSEHRRISAEFLFPDAF